MIEKQRYKFYFKEKLFDNQYWIPRILHLIGLTFFLLLPIFEESHQIYVRFVISFCFGGLVSYIWKKNIND